MEIFIALAILALIVRVVIFFACPELDNALSGHGGSQSEDFHNRNQHINGSYPKIHWDIDDELNPHYMSYINKDRKN